MLRTLRLASALGLALAVLGAPAMAKSPKATVAPRLVRALGPTSFALDREVVVELFADPGPLRGQLWVSRVPETTQAGPLAVTDVVGMKLHGIDPGSDIHRCGLRTGDVVRRLDGTVIPDVATAIAVGWRLRARAAGPKDSRFTMDLIRAGRPVTLTYQLVTTLPGAASDTPAPPEAPDIVTPSPPLEPKPAPPGAGQPALLTPTPATASPPSPSKGAQ